MLDVKTQTAEQAHVHIRDPDQSKSADQISTPIRVQQLIPSDYQEKDSYVVTEAVFACKEIEKFALDHAAARFAVVHAPVARLTKNFFMSDCPGNACNRNCKDKQRDNLLAKSHCSPSLDRLSPQDRLFSSECSAKAIFFNPSFTHGAPQPGAQYQTRTMRVIRPAKIASNGYKPP